MNDLTPALQPEWKRRFWATTGSSYLQMILRLVLGVILFRQLFSGLDQEEFGFWSLLWSLFGYGVLLDFGFGFTAQKAVAEKTAQGDLPGLNRLLATIFWTFIGLSVLLWVVFMLIRPGFLSGVEVAEADRAQFSRVYLIFFTGMALMFPLGLFPEILRGLQRVDLANWVGITTTVLHFTAIVTALALDWPFEIIMGISIASSLVPNLFAAYFAVRKLPGLSLNPRLFEWVSVKSQIGFSLAAYLITFSNLLMAKSDQLVIGLTIGVAAVTIYQAGYKMGEMLNLFSIQLQAALSPAAGTPARQRRRSGASGTAPAQFPADLLSHHARLCPLRRLPGGTDPPADRPGGSPAGGLLGRTGTPAGGVQLAVDQ